MGLFGKNSLKLVHARSVLPEVTKEVFSIIEELTLVH